jgi:hypothetical protein
MITRRTRAGRVTLFASIPLVALVTLAAGCGTLRSPGASGTSGTPGATGGKTTTASPAPGSATPVPTTTGGPVAPGQPACTSWPANAKHETLPASFVPVAVLRCVIGEQAVPGKGEWLTATLERADKNLAALIAALHNPPGRTSPAIMCPQIEMQPPQIALVGPGGQTIVPVLPVSGCDMTQEQVLVALARLSWHTVSVRLVSQIETPQQVASGCAPVYSDPFLASGSVRPSASGTVYAATPASLQICVYTASVSANTAQFVRGTSVSGPAESELLSGLSGTRGSTLCTLPHPMFAVVGGAGAKSPVIYVELGGCDRVVRYLTESGGLMGISTGQATPGAVAMIESLTHSSDPIATVPLTPYGAQ